MEDAATRRARLKAIRDAAGGAEPAGEAPADAVPAAKDAPPTEEPVLKFRNYAVRDDKIAHEKVSLITSCGASHSLQSALNTRR